MKFKFFNGPIYASEEVAKKMEEFCNRDDIIVEKETINTDGRSLLVLITYDEIVSKKKK